MSVLRGAFRPSRYAKGAQDQAEFQRLLRRDAIGWGYTLVLPWGTYRPGMKSVPLKVCSETLNGAPFYVAGILLMLVQFESLEPHF